MSQAKWVGRALSAALLTGSMAACDFAKVTESNPNAVPDASTDQLFTAAQVNTFFFTESQISRLASMWMQQMAGTDRQFTALDIYNFGESEGNGEWNSVYTGGGLIDLRRAIANVEEAKRRPYAGILKIHEAHLIGMAASVWGDIPYSEAVKTAVATPKLDKQADVYAAVQARLDEAIADLQGSGASAGGADMNFGGSAAKWTAVANTLKARFYMHWVEAQQAGLADATTACGGNCLQKAEAAARAGIQSFDGTWRAIHTSAATESNAWSQFVRDRSGYISAGEYMVNLLKDRNDPRLSIYFTKTKSGEYIGSAPGKPDGDLESASSQLNEAGIGAPSYSPPMVSCAENHFILAEARQRLGNDPGAQTALVAGVACNEAELAKEIAAFKGKKIPVNAGLTGAALLDEIMKQKYMALPLSIEVWNDYKRSCLPGIKPYGDKEVPGRLFYGSTEAGTNPNIPAADKQVARNTNDPKGCRA